MGIKNYDILGLDIDGNLVEEFMILRAPFWDCVENWDTVPDIDPRMYTLVRASDGEIYLMSVYDNWQIKQIANYENYKSDSTSFLDMVESKLEVHTIVENGNRSRDYELACNSDGEHWYYEGNKEELRQKLDRILKNKNRSLILFENRTKLLNGESVDFYINEDDIVCIMESHSKTSKLIKDVHFTISEDMSFHAFIKDQNSSITKVEFEYDINHPLYFCVKRLLGDNTKLIINDDKTKKRNKNYLKIEKDEYKIKFTFVNEIKNNKFYVDRFGINIINLGFDPRSKTKLAVKEKLINFFKDAEEVLKEDYIQMDFDECKEINEYIKKKKRGK